MTIKTTELLKLFTKVEKLGLSVNVREDKDGDYVIKIFNMFEFDSKFEPYKVVITQTGESDWNKGNFYYFDCMMDILDEMLEKQKQKEIKEQKRQELIAKLTPEERELLNLN
jgi:hypothetical protein